MKTNFDKIVDKILNENTGSYSDNSKSKHFVDKFQKNPSIGINISDLDDAVAWDFNRWAYGGLRANGQSSGIFTAVEVLRMLRDNVIDMDSVEIVDSFNDGAQKVINHAKEGMNRGERGIDQRELKRLKNRLIAIKNEFQQDCGDFFTFTNRSGTIVGLGVVDHS